MKCLFVYSDILLPHLRNHTVTVIKESEDNDTLKSQ